MASIDDKWWGNPLVSALIGATVALGGTLINNRSTLAVERSRMQSTIMLEAVKTNGDTNAACRNLLFYTSLGLIEDTNHAITGACPGSVQGIPSVSVGNPDAFDGTYFYPLRVQTMDADGNPVSDVRVEATLVPSNNPLEIPPDFLKSIASDKNYDWIVRGTSSHCASGKDGYCYLEMAPKGRFIAILAKKEGFKGNRTNVFFQGMSVPIMVEKTR